MMEYRIKRAAPDELKHWGIKGQKWGIRRYQNADGTLTEEGKLRYRSGEEQKKLADTIKNHGSSNEALVKIPQIQATLASVKDTAKKLGEAQNELDKYENDWYSRKNPEAYDKYTRKLAEEMTSKYDHSTKEEDIQIRLDLIRNDDLDQGESFQMYLQDNPSAMKAFKAAQEKESAAYKAHKEAIASYTKEWLGDHANDQMKLWSFGGYTQYAPVSNRLEGMIYAESMRGLRHSEGGTHMSDYVIHRDAEYLEHFGVSGMKWGERRFQNPDGTLTELGKQRYGSGGERSARRTKWDLNKLDREQTNAKARYDYYDRKSQRSIAKANKKLRKAEASGDEERIAKMKQKVADAENSKVTKNAAEYKALLERSKAMTEKIIKASIEKGYSIHSKDVLRTVNRGHSVAASALGTIGGMGLALATGGIAIAYTQSEYAPGKHYRVRNDGLGTQTHRSRRFNWEPHRSR